MLIGCGCNCTREEPFSAESGSAQSVQSEISEIFSPINCGACYALPANWTVTVDSDWLTIFNPNNEYNDCRSAFNGTFILYSSIGATANAERLSGGAWAGNPAGDGFRRYYWQSSERAAFTDKFEQDGTPAVACRLSPNFPRVELIAVCDTALPQTRFFLFFWWTTIENWGEDNSFGVFYSWEMNPLISGEDVILRNCVRCYTAVNTASVVNALYNLWTDEYPWENPGRFIEVCPT